jgi:hypothetical protein
MIEEQKGKKKEEGKKKLCLCKTNQPELHVVLHIFNEKVFPYVAHD